MSSTISRTRIGAITAGVIAASALFVGGAVQLTSAAPAANQETTVGTTLSADEELLESRRVSCRVARAAEPPAPVITTDEQGNQTRDHRSQPVVRDHRAKPVVRDHRDQPVVRDHREKKSVCSN